MCTGASGKNTYSKVAPVGLVWREVTTKNPIMKLYEADGSHPNIDGGTLTAYVLISTMTGKPCYGVPMQYVNEISEKDHSFLQLISWELFSRYKPHE